MHFFSGRIDFPRRHAWPRGLTIVIAVVAAVTLFTLLGLSRSNAAPGDITQGAVNWPMIRLELVAGDFDDPVNVVSPDDGTNRLFVVERGGLIHIIQNGARLEETFLNIEDKVAGCSECGLLGLAFPPDFADSGYFFINYTSDTNLVDPDPDDVEDTSNDQKTGDTVIARLRVSGNPNVADANSEEAILIINQPASNHNGGHILFGPDDRLYIGMGDGGGGGDEYRNAQDPKSLLGKILRIQVGATGTYTIPNDNPFINTPDYRPEIWATGVRNPWRFNFDPATGDFYLADVGQSAYEEVNHIAAADIDNGGSGNGGMNFGWPILEGNHCFPPSDSQNCDRTGLVAPVATYAHNPNSTVCSVTGGYVYRSDLPLQMPIYLYADFCSGEVFGLQRDGDGWVTSLIEDYPFAITSFGEDAAGNIYLVSYSGDIYRIVDRFNHRQYMPSINKPSIVEDE